MDYLSYTSRRHGCYQDIEFSHAVSGRVRQELENLGYKYIVKIRSWRGRGRYDEAIAVADKAVERSRRYNTRTRKETLCWSCAKSGHGCVSMCSWEREFVPVDGWEAQQYFQAGNDYKNPIETYHVIECPLYEPDPPRKTVRHLLN